MDDTSFNLMQAAVDIVAQSPHPTNKIAATLAGTGRDGAAFAVSMTNLWPAPIEQNLGRDTRVGNSSGTIHAETACILTAPLTEGASLYVTDPPCPNCIKNMAEAGIRQLYIDHKGFDKDFALRRGHHFQHMAMQICEKAGISVYVVYRKDQKIKPVLEISDGFKPAVEKPLRIEKIPGGNIDTATFNSYIKSRQKLYEPQAFALCFARDASGDIFVLSAEPHPTIGYTTKTLEEPEGKYSFIMEPVNRLIMAAARHGLKIENDYLYSSRIPTAREQVNMAGADLSKIHIGDMTECRDNDGLAAMQQLKEAGIIQYLT